MATCIRVVVPARADWTCLSPLSGAPFILEESAVFVLCSLSLGAASVRLWRQTTLTAGLGPGLLLGFVSRFIEWSACWATW
jgi:hypothetical protein